MTRLFASRALLFLMIIGFFQKTVHAQHTLFKKLDGQFSGVNFKNTINESEDLNVMAYEYFFNGGGVAVGDVNNDGLDDIFFTANMKPNKLYLNQGKLKFKDITKTASEGLEGKKGAWKTGVTMADVNGDGFLDIYICYSGKVSEDLRRNQLYINLGKQKDGSVKFVEKAKEYGVDSPCYSTQAAFLDYDLDGDLDMFLLNHNVKKYDNMELARLRTEVDSLAGNKFYENQNGHFVDVSAKAGIHQYPLTFGLGIAIADVNMDGLPDIYVTNDYNEPDYLYLNKGNGTFLEQTPRAFRHLAQFSMGVDIADFNNDALPDILSLDMLPEDNHRQKSLQLQENYESFELMQQQGLHKQYMHNMLQLNLGNDRSGFPTFSEIARLSGVASTDWSWCPLVVDFDNDGLKDIFISNGYLRDYTNKDFLRYWGDYKIKKAMDREPMQLMDLVMAMPSTKLANYIFKNEGNLQFSNQQTSWGFTEPTVSSGAAYADLDNDGDLELIINNINDEASIYENLSNSKSNHYIQLSFSPENTTKTVLGTKVYIHTGSQTQYQEVNPYKGYLSCESLKLHFGLGSTAKIDSIKILWPDRTEQWLRNVEVNQLLKIKKAGKPSEKVFSNLSEVFQATRALIPYRHEAYLENDFKRQPLMLSMYSSVGPVLAKADVNNDKLDDLFISGNKNQNGKIFMQMPDGKFTTLSDLEFGDESSSAIAAATFLDVNQDGFPDLYLAKGGYSVFESQTPSLQDELFVNNGKGGFVKQILPDVSASSKAFVKPCDFDLDGDLDMLVGGRVIPGKYPVAPTSYLLVNDGKGNFTLANIPFAQIGMLTDALWHDINQDGRPDLILVGEMMPIKVFINSALGFVDKSKDYFKEEDHGFWYSIAVADLNSDGIKDIIVGNQGTNAVIKANKQEPAKLYFADFDENGSIDPFFCFFVQGKSYPYVSRDELNDQIFPMRRKFSSYKQYADATIQEIFSPEDLSKASQLKLDEVKTSVFLSQIKADKTWSFLKGNLPIQAQFAPVTQILVKDFDKDGNQDVLLLGNKTDNRLKLGSMDANYGCLLKGNGKGNLEYMPQIASGLSVRGDVKSSIELEIAGKTYLIIGAFNQALQFYKE
ncbi:MAG: VCBS repeat-containing protein [Flectobacillus sp.]|uniref:VCBS repeat-containing protein n=1 Tax=Flectobacillus sp. TaxID=50419 RepID=UPI003B98E9B8